jgi:hypothetical protein
MAEVTVSEALWTDLAAAAGRQRRRPEALVERVLRDYLCRLADEELIEETTHAARRTKFRTADTETIIRQYRRNKARTRPNGRTKSPNAGGD